MKLDLNLPGEATFKAPALTWKRLLAFAIDFWIINFIIGYPFRDIILTLVPSGDFFQSYSFIISHPRLATLISLIMILVGILALLYFALFEYKIGQTLGKMIMGIRVESTADNLTFFACLIRSLYFLLIFPFILLWIIDPVFLVFTKEKRRLSEILSRTRTVAIYNVN